MSFTVDWQNKIVDSDASITDIPAAHVALRLLESSDAGILHPTIITYKEIVLGGGATLPALAFVNGYRLRFPAAGSYSISGGNLLATIVPVAGVFVERNQAAAYAVTSIGSGGAGGGGSGLSADEVAAAVFNANAGSYDAPGSFGRILNRVLTVAKFLTYKDGR